jgi:hypothetical protein
LMVFANRLLERNMTPRITAHTNLGRRFIRVGSVLGSCNQSSISTGGGPLLEYITS